MLIDDVKNLILFIVSQKKDITEDYHDWLKICFALISEFGENARDFFHEVSQFYPKYTPKECDDQFDKCLEDCSCKITIASLFWVSANHGIDISQYKSSDTTDFEKETNSNPNSNPNPNPNLNLNPVTQSPELSTINDQPSTNNEQLSTNPDKPKRKIDIIIDYLRSKYLMRFNTITNRVEYKLNNSQEEFIPIDDREENSLIIEMSQKDIKCSVNLLRIVLCSDVFPKFDPFLSYFNSLPVWNGNIDYIMMLSKVVPTDNDELWQIYLKKWLVGAVTCALESEKINHQILILTSSMQGNGKTTFCINLSPLALRKYIYSGNFDPNNKDTWISLAENFMTIFEELHSFSKYETTAIKSIITQKQIKIRPPYGRNSIVKPRRTSFIGSGNIKQYLNDESGSRRFLNVTVTGIINNNHNIDNNMVWSQAYALYKQDYKYWFDGEDIQGVETNNEAYQIMTKENELLLTYFEPVAKDRADKFLTATEIGVKIQQSTGINFGSGFESRMGKALTKSQFVCVMRKGRKLYAVREIPFEEIEENRRKST